MLKVQSRFHEYYQDALNRKGDFKDAKTAMAFVLLYEAMDRLVNYQDEIEKNINSVKADVGLIERAIAQGYTSYFTAYQQQRIQEFVTFFEPYIYPNGRPKNERGFPWAIVGGVILALLLGGLLWIIS